ncbi:MAG TPA: hypothetical protein PKM88_02550 [bacterium]|nr:hypothetical protein [bacterium]
MTENKVPAPQAIPGKLKNAFARRFCLRHHMALMMAVMISVGILANQLLKQAAVWSLPLRFGLVVTAAYLAFFPVGLVWLAYIRRELSGDSTWPRQVVEEGADPEKPATARTGDADLADGVEVFDVAGDIAHAGSAGECSCALAMLIPLLLIVVACGGYLIVQAPMILTDAAFETLLALALVRPVRNLERYDRSTGLFGATWHWYGLILVLAVVAGMLLETFAPGAHTLGAALRQLL